MSSEKSRMAGAYADVDKGWRQGQGAGEAGCVDLQSSAANYGWRIGKSGLRFSFGAFGVRDGAKHANAETFHIICGADETRSHPFHNEDDEGS